MDYARNLYLSQEPAYQNFREFLQHEIGMTYEDADDVALDIWDKIQFDMAFTDIIRYLMDDYEELLDDTKMEQFVQLLQELNNNTRMQIHRGHTPNEMIQKEMEEEHFAPMPIVVSGSTKADHSFKKIYPNDPCPCGSGKKFKKCCGKHDKL